MKIGVITFHAAFNYGSALQAYALQEYLSARGHDVSIIDFRSLAQRRLYPAPVCFNSVYNTKQSLRRLFFGWPEIRFMSRKRSAFRRFMSGYMNLTPVCFRSEAEMKRHDWSSYDMIVCGSDQIWNPSAIDFSFAYLLDFLENEAGGPEMAGSFSRPLRVAYAPSAGPHAMDLNAGRLAKYVSRYDAVSVREQETAALLKASGAGSLSCPVLPDPVLLHDAGFYREMLPASGAPPHNDGYRIPHRYILYYAPGRRNSQAEMLADAVSSGMMGDGASSILPDRDRMPVVRITDGSSAPGGSIVHRIPKQRPTTEICIPAGPAEFISLLDGASCTVGTSFHLMVFSMLFGKDFWCPDAASDSRKSRLLESLGLSPSSSFFRFSSPEIRPRLLSALSALRHSADCFWSGLGV